MAKLDHVMMCNYIGEQQICKVPGCGFCDVWESTEYILTEGINKRMMSMSLKTTSAEVGDIKLTNKKSLGTSLTANIRPETLVLEGDVSFQEGFLAGI